MDWTQRVAVLADQLSAAGKLTSPAWRAAFCAVPRHELVPEIYTQDEHRRWCPLTPGTDTWWELVYSDTTVITSVLPSSRGLPWPVSSSTKPGLLLRMLEALDVEDGMRVLEIGTGSGYNAAVLCARLGARQVYSVDLRPELVELARDRLARLGYRPTLVARDGVEGLAEHGPFDRIIVTCGMPLPPRLDHPAGPRWAAARRPGRRTQRGQPHRATPRRRRSGPRQGPRHRLGPRRHGAAAKRPVPALARAIHADAP